MGGGRGERALGQRVRLGPDRHYWSLRWDRTLEFLPHAGLQSKGRKVHSGGLCSTIGAGGNNRALGCWKSFKGCRGRGVGDEGAL